MKCPYCMSDIHDKAVVCPTCTRDVQFAVPIWKRIDELEADLTSFIEKVQDIKIEINRPNTTREATLSRLFQAAKLISLYLLLSVLLIALTKNASIIADLFLFWAYSAVNFLFGSAVGFSKPNEPRRYYFSIALILAVTDLAVRGSTYHWNITESLIFLISDILWFWSGYVFGQRLRSWAKQGQTYSLEGFPLATLIGAGSTDGENAPATDQGDKLREVVRIVTPLVLSIVSTIVATLVKK